MWVIWKEPGEANAVSGAVSEAQETQVRQPGRRVKTRKAEQGLAGGAGAQKDEPWPFTLSGGSAPGST